MFKLLSVKPNIDIHRTILAKDIMSPRQTPALLAAALSGFLLLTGCQQQAAEPVADDTQSTEQTNAEDSKPVPQSDSASARIEQFQPIYVAQAQRLQRRLQAEYESLQAADTSAMPESLLPDETTNSLDNTDDVTKEDVSSADAADAQTTADTSVDIDASDTNGNDVNGNANNTPSSATDDSADSEEADINTSTEIGERDLTVLKRISLEPRKPTILTEAQMIESYQQAVQALYQPVTTALSAEDTNTLINIATLAPKLFEHAEIAGRVNAKSPALARLLIQHQVWEQIEAQQVLDMQQMKRTQQQEFEQLMAKFNDTIKDYDEQIAKYEQTLKAFQ